MSSLALPLTLPAVPCAVRCANRHALPLAVTLLVHGLALLPMLSAWNAAPLAPQTVMVGVVVSGPVHTRPAQAQEASTPPTNIPPPAPAPTSVRRSPVTPTHGMPAKAAPQTRVEPAQQHPASPTVPDVMPSSVSAATPTGAATENTDSEPPRYQAAYLNNPQPPYPVMSRKLREQGSVRLNVMVNAAGEAEAVRIKSGSGFDRLDQAALAAVQKWRFVPARQHGQAVAGWVEVPIQFHLEN